MDASAHPIGEAPEQTGVVRDYKEHILSRFFREEKKFLLIITFAFVAAALSFGQPQVAMWVGFMFAGYSAVANDSIQTLGTFIAANKARKWWQLWLFVGGIFLATITYSWVVYDGDVSYGRLMTKGFAIAPTEFNFIQIAAPAVLMVLTRMRMPVSTSLLLLGCFATQGKGIWDVCLKSVSGYAVAILVAVALWMTLGRWMREKFQEREAGTGWVAAQWISTAFLWTMWLQHDLANIAVFLPRSMGAGAFIAVAATIFFGLGLMLRQGGENIQEVVDEKSGVSDLRSATIINLVFAVILLVFKEWSSVPMSTTWVFIGLLAGREISLAARKSADNGRTVKLAVRMAAWDLTKVTAGFVVSIGVAALANDNFRAGLFGG
ncbi:MAG: hypothetical protein ACI9U2_001495 [Bradymonadia bacterium]|jgi:hypothetical protein